VKTLAILVDGGPAPGINAVIAAATIEARNHGVRVVGCYDGFRWLMQGDPYHVTELEIADVGRLHFDGGSMLRTSRANPAAAADGSQRVADTLRSATTPRSRRRGWPRWRRGSASPTSPRRSTTTCPCRSTS